MPVKAYFDHAKVLTERAENAKIGYSVGTLVMRL
jgi:hypothetical protein